MPFANEIRELAYVQRWGIFRRTRDQTVAEHSYFVAIYVGQIADLIDWGGDRGVLLQAALIHDAFEGESGDCPGPFKSSAVDKDKHDDMEVTYFQRHMPEQLPTLRQLRLRPDVKAIVKLADMFEGSIYLACEWFAGNQNAGSAFRVAKTPARDMYLSLKTAWAKLIEVCPVEGAEEKFSILAQAIATAETRPPRIAMRNLEE